jgi:hypothetical protein
LACTTGKLEVVKCFVENAFDAALRCAVDEKPALAYAAENGHTQVENIVKY